MIPAGFRLGDGWHPRYYDDYSECTRAMEDRAYGHEALNDAWEWFKCGWEELRAALVAAEQRADRAEDKLRRIGKVVKTSGCDCDCEHHGDECSEECQRCTGCLIDTILREGTL